MKKKYTKGKISKKRILVKWVFSILTCFIAANIIFLNAFQELINIDIRNSLIDCHIIITRMKKKPVI